MKKKVCNWLDSNIRGGIQIVDSKIYPCCCTDKPMIELQDFNYESLSVEKIRDIRIQFYNDINEGKKCVSCPLLIEKEEEDINIGPIKYLSIGPFDTCNLRCAYCYFTPEQLGAKLDPQKAKIFPMIKNWHEAGMLKDPVEIGLAGGEPSLMSDIPESLNFLAENYSTVSVSFISNSSIKNRCEKLADEFACIPSNVHKVLYTSIDAGTPETYKKVRGADLYYTTLNNIINYAKKDSFETILLKYILMFEGINTSDENIFNFLLFVKAVMSYNKNKTSLTIDYDFMHKNPVITEEMVAAAGKLYYVATEILKIDIEYAGGSITPAYEHGRSFIAKMKEYANNYGAQEKTSEELYYLNMLNEGVIIKEEEKEEDSKLRKFKEKIIAKFNRIFNKRKHK